MTDETTHAVAFTPEDLPTARGFFLPHRIIMMLLFAAFVALYAPGRFLVSFVREERIWVWGLQEAQIIALIALTGAVLALGWFWRQTHGATRPRPALVRK